jgi:hypothetical protein
MIREPEDLPIANRARLFVDKEPGARVKNGILGKYPGIFLFLRHT